jgi:hypothetical protein
MPSTPFLHDDIHEVLDFMITRMMHNKYHNKKQKHMIEAYSRVKMNTEE